MSEPVAVGFTGLVDLASAALGGRALGASDEFFAGAENLVQPGRGVFIEGRFTDRGKWMDGWESRRRRAPRAAAQNGDDALDDDAGADCDWCVLRLGAPGEVIGFDVDTNHFIGNHPPFASIEGLPSGGGPSLSEASLDEIVARRDWIDLLPQSPLRPGSQNLFAALPRAPVGHVRLRIFPDGGVARLRVFGRVAPLWQPARASGDPDLPASLSSLSPEAVDLSALRNGGQALACSDAFFGPMNNLLLPGRATDMGGGWETRRRRGPGYDWILIKLGAPGAIDVVEVDTNHFKGNFPDRCSVEAIHGPDARITDLIASPAWTTLVPETKLRAHERHFFTSSSPSASASASAWPATHVRLNIFPDGGVSRLRLWGRRHG